MKKLEIADDIVTLALAAEHRRATKEAEATRDEILRSIQCTLGRRARKMAVVTSEGVFVGPYQFTVDKCFLATEHFFYGIYDRPHRLALIDGDSQIGITSMEDLGKYIMSKHQAANGQP